MALDHFVTLVGIGGQFAPYIQAFKIFKIHDAHDISLTANLVVIISMFVWLMYGVKRKVKPLIISNVFGIIGVLLIFGGIFYYG